MASEHLYLTDLVSRDSIDRYQQEVNRSGGKRVPLNWKAAQVRFLENDEFIRNPLMHAHLIRSANELSSIHDRYFDRLTQAGALLSNRKAAHETVAWQFVACINDFTDSILARESFERVRKVSVITESDTDPQFSVGQLLLYFVCSARGMASGFKVLDEIEAQAALLRRIHEKPEHNLSILYLWRGFLHLVAGREAKALCSFKESKRLCNINLTAQIYSEKLAAKLAGKPDKKLAGRFCSYPFTKLYTNQSGETHHCCLAFSPLRAGAIDDQTFDWNSKSSIEFRRSILDGSFTYCDKASCSFIVGGALPSREEAIAEDPRLAHIIEKELTEIEPSGLELVFEHDASCNLACPSCRSTLIAHPKIATEKLDQRFPYLLNLASKSKRLSVSGFGDPFFSRHYRHLLTLVNKSNSPGLRIDLITNALLLTPQTWQSYAHLHSMFESISVSIDAAKPETYAKVRKLGDFARLTSNLEFISKLRQQGYFSTFLIQFVVQAANYREMEDFVALGQRLGVDGVIFQRLFPYGVYADPGKFEKADVFSPSHPEHQDFLKILRSDRLKKVGVSFSTFQDLYDRLNPIDYYFDVLKVEGNSVAAHGWAYIKAGWRTGNVSLMLKRGDYKKRFVFAAIPIRRDDVAASVERPDVAYCGFSASSGGKNLPAGRYQVGIRVTTSAGSVTDFTSRYVDVIRGAKPPPAAPIEYSIDIFRGGNDIVVHGWAYLAKDKAIGLISVVLRSLSKKRRFVLDADTSLRPDVAKACGCERLVTSGFAFSLKGRVLPPGEYEIGICIDSGSRKLISYSGKTVTLDALPQEVA